MGREYIRHALEEEFIQDFGGETRGKENNNKTLT
jgi:hypothetical protein